MYIYYNTLQYQSQTLTGVLGLICWNFLEGDLALAIQMII